MIDFDALVLKPIHDVFAIAVRVTPLVSQPGEPAYDARMAYTSTALDVVMQDDTIFSDQQTKLGLRYKEFPTAIPDRGDLIEIMEPSHWAFGKKYWVGDVDDDGQGGADLLLRAQQDTPIPDEGS